VLEHPPDRLVDAGSETPSLRLQVDELNR